jgi:hypothetical protein
LCPELLTGMKADLGAEFLKLGLAKRFYQDIT